jgi:spore germination protein KC
MVAEKLRMILALLILTTTVLTGGCWDRMEIENIAFVNAIGVDRAGSGNLLVTFYVVNPDAMSKQGGKGPPAYVASLEAPTVGLALAKYAEQSARQPRYKQLQAIILGEDLARQGVAPVMDYFGRFWGSRLSIPVLVARGKAQDILVKGQTPPEKLASSGIEAILSQTPSLSGTRFSVVLGDVLTNLTRTGMQPVITSLELVPMREATTGGPYGEHGTATSEGSASEENQVIACKGAGVFREDKLLDFLTPTETRGLLWLQGKVQGGRMVVPAPDGGNEGATLAVERESTKIKPVVTADKISYQVKIAESGYIDSVESPDLAVDKRGTIDLLEQEQANAIQQEVMQAVSKAKTLQSDFLGLGDKLYRQDPGTWEQVKNNWNAAWLPQVEVDVTVDCLLQRTGSAANPVEKVEM